MRDGPHPPLRLGALPRFQSRSTDDLLSTSAEDLHAASPPYRPVASSSNLNLHSADHPPSPAYTSTTGPNGMDKTTTTPALDDPDPRPNESDAKTARPTVHYPVDLRGPTPGYTRADSADVLSSRPSSIAGTDDEDSEDYDWSGEDDLVDSEAKFEERMGVKVKRKGWSFKRIITMLFSTLIGSTFLAGVLITPGILIHFYWYKPHPTPERLYIKQNVQAWLFWAAANLVISWYLAMVVNIIPVFTQFFISLSWGHVSEYVKTRIEMYDSVKDTIKPLLYAASGWASWVIIFGHIYPLFNTENQNESRAPYTMRVSQVIEFLFFLALVICAKRLLSHAIAFAFHRTAYKDRIESVQESLAAIEKLHDYRPKPSHPPRSAHKSGTRTPVFGSLGFSPFSEKDHFNFLSSALHNASQPGSRVRRHKDSEHGNGEDGDIDDDGDRTAVGTASKKGALDKGKEKVRNRSSWTVGGEKISRQTTETAEDGVAPSSDYEMDFANSAPSTPPASNPPVETHPLHRYPPTARTDSPRPSISNSDGGEVALIQAAKVIKNAVLHDARNIKGKNDGLASMAWNVSSTHEAKRLARSVYMKFKNQGRTYLLPSDFYPVFPDNDAAEAAFRVFDKDNNGDISRAEIKSTLVRVYKERRFLSRSMRDVGAALKTLDQILLLFAMIILFFISLSVFGVQVGDSLTSVYSIGIAASFIFKNSASSAFDAIMFLFVTHPYDTGDRCFIDKENLVVKKVGLFATVFARSDGTETYYFNSQLFTKFITNVRRSGKTFENLTMQIAWRTPLEKLDALEKSINEWLSTEENRWYEPSTSITLQSIGFQRYLEITIGIGHNGYDWGLRNARKTAFHAAVQYYCRQLGIVGYEAPMPIVYGNPEANAYTPPPSTSPGAEDTRPFEPGDTKGAEEDVEREAKNMKPVLGFLPPLSTRSTQLTRARKSKSRKTVLRAMDN